MNIKNKIAKVLFKISPTYHMEIQNSNTMSILNKKIDNLNIDLQARSTAMQVANDHMASQEQKIDFMNHQLGDQERKIEFISEQIKNQALALRILFHEDYHVEKEEGDGNEDDYIEMQRRHYENKDIPSMDIVGQYNWHEKFPYETFLLYKYGDIRYPIFTSFKDKKALDFGCGPGRMVKRMSSFFEKVDGCDISARLLEEAKNYVPQSDFYLTNGNDLGRAPYNTYDFIYCTISMQHIASHTIRMQIIKKMYELLKNNGRINLQMAYNPHFPYVYELSETIINDKKIITKGRLNQADYLADDFNAQATNGAHDVGIGEKDLELMKRDLEKYFVNVTYWFADVADYYDNLQGETHSNYWATSWIFIYGEKMVE